MRTAYVCDKDVFGEARFGVDDARERVLDHAVAQRILKPLQAIICVSRARARLSRHEAAELTGRHPKHCLFA